MARSTLGVASLAGYIQLKIFRKLSRRPLKATTGAALQKSESRAGCAIFGQQDATSSSPGDDSPMVARAVQSVFVPPNLTRIHHIVWKMPTTFAFDARSIPLPFPERGDR